jgi:RHS repeat-associated protein
MVTNMAGAVTERTGYAAFGEPVPGTSLPKGFIGERPDVETGLEYLNFRYYDPISAHFASPDDLDPTLPGVGTNRYAYAGNDPVNKSDPNGHFFDAATAAKLTTAGGFAAVDGPAPFGDIIAAGILLSMIGGDTPDHDREVENRTAEYQQMGMSRVIAENSAMDHTRRGYRSEYADHHVFPQTLANHELFKTLGISINDKDNLVNLPTHAGVNSSATIHSGRHTNDYTRARRTELDNILRDLTLGKINKSEAESRLRSAMRAEKERLLSGETKLNASSVNGANERAGMSSSSGATSSKSPAHGSSGGGFLASLGNLTGLW